MSCPSVTTIQKTECIGNSLATINANYDSLATAACDNQAQIDELRSLINGLSSNMNKNVNYPYAEFRTSITVGGTVTRYSSSTFNSSLQYQDSDFSIIGYTAAAVIVPPGSYDIEVDCSNLFANQDGYELIYGATIYPGAFSASAAAPQAKATFGTPLVLPGSYVKPSQISTAATVGGTSSYKTKRVFASTDSSCQIGPAIYGYVGYRTYFGGQVVMRLWKLA